MKRILTFCLVVFFLVSCGGFANGGKDQRCREPDSKKGQCDPGLVCTECLRGSFCTEDGACPRCGEVGYDCCPEDTGNVCQSGLGCTNENLCQRCGNKGGPCCQGDIPCIGHGILCGVEGTCQQCGVENGPCCMNDSCGKELICGDDQLCHSCGIENERCCEGNFCYGTVCGNDGICHGQICETGESCQPCGKEGESCCVGETCGPNATCSGEGVCEDCGGLDEPVCKNNQCDYWREGMRSEFTACQCDAWYLPVDGYCRNPFMVDPSTNTDVCLASNDFGKAIIPGYERTLHSHLTIIKKPPNKGRADYPDWCFWYGAYVKNDIEICAKIDWDEMQALCIQGENPDDYFVILQFENNE